MTFPSSICRAELTVEASLKSVGLRCWGVSFWFVIFMVDWVVVNVRFLFVMKSWILFCCTGFFRFFLVISDGFQPLWSGSPPHHVSITNEDKQMLLPRQRFNRLKGNENWHCVFLQSLNSIYFSLLRFFVVYLFVCFSFCFLLFSNSIPSTRVKHQIMMMIMMMVNVNDNKS